MYFDTHAHINDEQFDADREGLIKEIIDSGTIFTEIGCSIPSSSDAVRLAKRFDGIYAAVGVHPDDVGNMTDSDLDTLKKLSESAKVVAIGEIGLDYHYDDSPSREVQQKWFAGQIELAQTLGLPISVHSRDAVEDTIKILKGHKGSTGIIHCFSGSVETAKIYLDMGYFISLAGPVTFKNARGLIDVAKYIPDDRILIETDSPYMSPEPNRGKRNCPMYVRHVCEKLAELRGIGTEKMAEITTKNAKSIYKIYR